MRTIQEILLLFEDFRNVIGFINLFFQFGFIYLLFIRLKGRTKISIHCLWQIPVFFVIIFSTSVLLYDDFSAQSYQEFLGFLITVFYMAAVTKTKISYSLTISAAIFAIMFCISVPALILSYALFAITDIPMNTLILVSSIIVLLLQIGVIVSTYKVRIFRNGISLLLEKDEGRFGKRAILISFLTAALAFTLFVAVATHYEWLPIISLIGFLVVVVWNIVANIKDSVTQYFRNRREFLEKRKLIIGRRHLIRKLFAANKESEDARGLAEKYRMSEHTITNTLRSAAHKEKDRETKNMLEFRVRQNQLEKELLLNPINSGIKAIDTYLKKTYYRAIEENIDFTVHIKQKLTDFSEKGISSGEIDEIIRNLIENAFKYAFLGEEGQAIEPKTITLSVVDYKITVSDTGLHFPEKVLEKLGELGVTTHGRGFGFPTVISILKRYDGSYEIIPKDGQKYGKSVKISFEN